MLGWDIVLVRLSLAALFGGLIGLERERKDWAAGLRTHMMVSVGSCLAMIVSSFGFFDILGTENVRLDPARVAAQVISGIGFIGAGTILFMRQGAVRGLTTAAGLWTVATIGLATGGGLYFAAGAATFIALIILWALKPIESRFSQRFKQKTLRVVSKLEINSNLVFDEILNNPKLVVKSFNVEKSETGFVFYVQFSKNPDTHLFKVIDSLSNNPYVEEVSWL